ncbi:gamma-glutamyl-gamma-aminobutyrate hydrolase [Pantoea sp. FN060301]|uniref:gamma-glutamyl-gamma-aminobutyrate hydrolase n=1 Tax=Pantoea sp. FN060301 TaxID=3420380 RepID=UPI003D175AF6
MGNILNKPLIGVVMCQMTHDGHPAQMVHNKYLDAVLLAGGIPLALPHNLSSLPFLPEQVLGSLQGVLLTGSSSNIEPHHYGDTAAGGYVDPGRDRLVFALIEAAIHRQLPLLGICRGLQELVVATGGSLHPQLHHIPGFQEHRENPSQPLSERYAPVHDIHIQPGGLLARLAEGREGFSVNSLHQQGIRSLSARLRIEALAGDGLPEAVSLRDHPFALAVQWHPEWQSESAPLSRQLFGGFIKACQRQQKETGL